MLRARDSMSPTGKMGDDWDIARAAVFLASDDAKFINGIVLPVDGGQHALMRGLAWSGLRPAAVTCVPACAAPTKDFP